MELDEQRQKYRAINDWFNLPQGIYVAEALARLIAQYKPAWPQNANVLQLGLCGGSTLIAPKNTFYLTPCLNAKRASCIASPESLPLKKGSIDIVLAPFLFEIFGQNTRAFDEIDSVLNPMGHLICLGVNPLSLWGLFLKSRLMPRMGDVGLNLHTPLTLKRLLQARGYQQVAFETFYYVPPFKRDQWIQKSLFLNEMGKLMSVFPSGFYVLIMQKYQVCPAKLLRRASRETVWLPSA